MPYQLCRVSGRKKGQFTLTAGGPRHKPQNIASAARPGFHFGQVVDQCLEIVNAARLLT